MRISIFILFGFMFMNDCFSQNNYLEEIMKKTKHYNLPYLYFPKNEKYSGTDLNIDSLNKYSEFLKLNKKVISIIKALGFIEIKDTFNLLVVKFNDTIKSNYNYAIYIFNKNTNCIISAKIIHNVYFNNSGINNLIIDKKYNIKISDHIEFVINKIETGILIE